MAQFRLVPHADGPGHAVTAVTVSVVQKNRILDLRYSVEGALDQLRWPEPKQPVRTEELWKHTCFEVFIGHPQAGYIEYNFSPSTEWACYFFDWYRDGMRPATWLPEPIAHPSQGPRRELNAQIDLGPHWQVGDQCMGLSAIIEATDGTKSYWALAHAPGPPDFHNSACFTATLPAPAAP